MDEAILMTTSLLVGTGAGVVLAYARDRRLLRLYSDLVDDLSRMVQQRPGPPDPPAAAARMPHRPAIADLLKERAS